MTADVYWHQGEITRARRQERNEHKSFVLWFTGLSGSGKSTFAHAVEQELFQRNLQVMVLDGDNVRHGLNRDLGFAAFSCSPGRSVTGSVCSSRSPPSALPLPASCTPASGSVTRTRPHGDWL